MTCILFYTSLLTKASGLSVTLFCAGSVGREALSASDMSRLKCHHFYCQNYWVISFGNGTGCLFFCLILVLCHSQWFPATPSQVMWSITEGLGLQRDPDSLCSLGNNTGRTIFLSYLRGKRSDSASSFYSWPHEVTVKGGCWNTQMERKHQTSFNGMP